MCGVRLDLPQDKRRRRAKARQVAKLVEIRAAVIAAGYDTVAKHAVFGLAEVRPGRCLTRTSERALQRL